MPADGRPRYLTLKEVRALLRDGVLEVRNGIEPPAGWPMVLCRDDVFFAVPPDISRILDQVDVDVRAHLADTPHVVEAK